MTFTLKIGSKMTQKWPQKTQLDSKTVLKRPKIGILDSYSYAKNSHKTGSKWTMQKIVNFKKYNQICMKWNKNLLIGSRWFYTKQKKIVLFNQFSSSRNLRHLKMQVCAQRSLETGEKSSLKNDSNWPCFSGKRININVSDICLS